MGWVPCGALMVDWLYLDHLDLGVSIFTHEDIYDLRIFVDFDFSYVLCLYEFVYNTALYVLFDLIWMMKDWPLTTNILGTNEFEDMTWGY